VLRSEYTLAGGFTKARTPKSNQQISGEYVNMMKTDARTCGLAVRTVFGVLALGGAVLTAVAKDADVPRHAVHYGDLDVSQTPGATVLYRRIASAAEKVCSRFDRDDLHSKQVFKACVHKAIEDAVTAVNQPTLFTIYQSKQHARPLSVASLDVRSAPSP